MLCQQKSVTYQTTGWDVWSTSNYKNKIWYENWKVYKIPKVIFQGFLKSLQVITYIYMNSKISYGLAKGRQYAFYLEFNHIFIETLKTFLENINVHT